jgi:O-antigen biosynthesis protein
MIASKDAKSADRQAFNGWLRQGKMLTLMRRMMLLLLTFLLGPIFILLAATLLFFNLIHLLTRFTRQRMPECGPPPTGPASIIILNLNGRDLLPQCLSSVLEAVRFDGLPHEILLVDNGSTDQSVEYVRQGFPQVRIIELGANLGFSAGNNAGVRAARHEIVVLLNNDMVVERDFLRPLLNGFGPATFAVSSQILFQDQHAIREETGKTSARFRRGMVDYTHLPVEGRTLPRPYYPTFWAGGGSSAFHRARFLSMGGLQEVYSPVYVEDADLSYQAWKIGWEILFCPASVVHHKHRATTRRIFRPKDLEILSQRNQLLFIWRNIRSWRLLLSHCFFLPWNSYRLARDHGLGIWRGLAQAIMRMPPVQISKLGAPFRGVRSDREIFELFEKPGLFFSRRRRNLEPGSPGTTEERPRILWLTAYLPHAGTHGGAGRMLQLLLRLSRKYRITLLSFVEDKDELEFLPQVESICEHVTAVQRVPPPRWQLFPYEPFEAFRAPQMEKVLQQYLEDYDYSLLQLEYSQMGCYADRKLGIPSLLTLYEVDFAACLRRARLEKSPWNKARWFYNYLQVLDREVRLAGRADAAVCMTEPDARMLRRFCASVPLHVVNTGVDLDYFRPASKPATEPRMIFVGAFQHLPNVEAMTYFCREILPVIRQRLPDAKLTIVGSKPPPDVVALSRIPNVEVTGRVEDLRPYMAASSVYVVPLRLGVGIRGKILEAWSMAMAVVTTRVGCAGLRCENGKNILVSDTAESFAANVVTLLEDPQLRLRLGAEARRVVEEYYSWDRSAQQLHALYQSLLSGNLRHD